MPLQGLRRERVVLSSISRSHRGAKLACQKSGLKMSLQGLRRETAVLSSISGSHKGPNLAGQKAGGENVPPGAEAQKCCTVVNLGVS